MSSDASAGAKEWFGGNTENPMKLKSRTNTSVNQMID
jgi:hypothetical protein